LIAFTEFGVETKPSTPSREPHSPQGIPARDPVSAPKFLQRAIELQRLEQLPWPTNLFGEPASIAELMAEAAVLSAHTMRRFPPPSRCRTGAQYC
jgi:hypothetical protein